MSATMPGCSRPRSCRPNTDADFEGQPPHGGFQRHDVLLAHPLAQQAGAEAEAALELHVRAAVRQADDRVRIVQDLRDRFVIDVVLAVQERGVEILLDDEIEEGVDDALALHLGDLADGLAHQALVLRQHRMLHRHVVPPGAADPRRHRVDLELDRLGVQLLADLGIAVGAQFFVVRGEQDRMPGRQAAEGLRVAHGEEVGDAVGRAGRIGADALGDRLIDVRHLLLPLVRATHRLVEVVVDDRTAGGLGQPAHQAVLHLGAVAAAALDDAGAEFAQHVAKREHLLLVGPQRRKMHALRIVVTLVARHREAQRAGAHAVAHDVLHRLDLVVGRGALLAFVAHHVVAHRGVADQTCRH